MLKWSDLTVIEGQGRPALQILMGDPPQEHFLVERGILLLVKSHCFLSLPQNRKMWSVWIRLLSFM